jgi:hypothetical protein
LNSQIPKSKLQNSKHNQISNLKLRIWLLLGFWFLQFGA